MAYSAKSQKKYNDKCYKINVKFSPADPYGECLKKYLTDTGQSANSYIKSLIKKDLDEKGIKYSEDTNNIKQE
ncbi:hypothetical protein C824_001418 [Schaedlerella arabinosiphila]|nr:hypothetical protein C824_001418 [Schaedlerella arabinosiphila]